MLVCGVVSEEGLEGVRGGESIRREGGGGLAEPLVTSAILNEMTRGRMGTEYAHTHTHTKPHKC